MDGPSMADLDTIIELRDETKTKEPTHHVSSPSRKENLLQSTGMTPIPPAATNPGNTLLGNKSFNGGEFPTDISLPHVVFFPVT